MPSHKKTFFTARPGTEREKKSLTFLNLIKKRKSTSRTEISKLTDINIVSVSNYINSYIKKGLVIERGHDISTGGRRPELIELNKDWGFFIGIDIGSDYAKGVLINLDNEIIAEGNAEIAEEKNKREEVANLINKLITESKVEKDRIKKIGISVSASLGGISEGDIKTKEAIEDEVGVPVIMGESSVCAAFAEETLNPKTRESKKVLYLYKDIGYGVLISEDEFYQATEEEDYSYLRAWGESSSVASEAKNIIGQGVGTKIVDIVGGDPKGVTLNTVLKAVKEKDEVAIDLVKTSGMNLGVRAAYLINAFRPDVIVLGGGMEDAGDIFTKPLIKSINRFILDKIKDKVSLVPAILGREACVKGSAVLAIREAFIES